MEGTGVIATLALVVALVLVIGVALLVLALYNGLVRARLKTQEGWSSIDVQLQRRADLVPNLVETVKGYVAHERATLENVTRARSMLQSAEGPPGRGRGQQHAHPGPA